MLQASALSNHVTLSMSKDVPLGSLVSHFVVSEEFL